MDVIGPAVQGIEPGAFNEILAAMRAGNAYANVHSTKWLGGEIRAQLKKGRGGNHHNGKGKKGTATTISAVSRLDPGRAGAPGIEPQP